MAAAVECAESANYCDDSLQDLYGNAEKLSENVIKQLKPTLDQFDEKSIEITKNQNVLKERLQRENERLSESCNINDIKLAMGKVKHYQQKVENMKKEMKFLRNKSKELKQRGLKLKEKKDEEDKKIEEKRRKEIEHEESLIAKQNESPSSI